MRMGAHVDQEDPIAEARARGAGLSQFFLGDPQAWKGPKVAYPGGAEALRADAEAAGIDLLITGEPKQSTYHLAKELGRSVICMGHYASETFGVRALERVLQNEFRVETVWISEPTGI